MILVLAQLPSTSSATSCTSLHTPIYGDCENAICERIVFIDTESGYGTCARLPVVVEGSDLHRKILQAELAARGTTDKGTYQLDMERDWYFPEYRLESVDDYRRFHQSEDASGRYPRANSTLIRLDEGDIASVIGEWRRERSLQQDQQRFRRGRDIALTAVGILPLLVSMHFFRRGVSGRRRARSLTVAFALQGIVLAYGFALMTTGYRFAVAGSWSFLLALAVFVFQPFLLIGMALVRLLARRSRP